MPLFVYVEAKIGDCLMSKNAYRIKNKKTGFDFLLPKEECDRLVMEEPHNFVVTDEDYVSPLAAKEVKTSTFEKVVASGDGKEEEKEPKTLEDLTVAELKKILEEREIEFTKSAKKADLIELIQADDKKKAEEAASGDGKEEETEKTEETEE